MSVARFIADQRTKHAVPHAFTCRVLKVSKSWFYKWIKDPTTARAQRRAELDEAVKVAFEASERAHGSPRLHLDLTEPEPAQDGTTPTAWRVGQNTVADSMRRQGLVARVIRRRCGLTKQDKTAPKFPDLLKRDFTATAQNQRWVGDMKEITTGEGKLYLATVIDLCLPARAGGRDLNKPERAAGLRRDQDGRRRARRSAPHRRCRLPHRPWVDLHRQLVHEPVLEPEDPAEHGPGRVVL